MTTQPTLFASPDALRAAEERIADLESREREAIAAGESLAANLLEMHRMLDVLCPECRAHVDEMLGEGL